MTGVPAPGDEAALLGAAEQLRRRRLHRSRPLWEMWFLTGLPERRIGLFARMHHAIADGIAGVATLGTFLDATPGTLSTARASRAGSASAGGWRRAPAACWCARTTVASTATTQARPCAPSQPARRPSRIFSQVPSPDQRRCRLYTVFQFPNRPGRSRHGHPARVRKKIPSITSR